jgi:hypothetical protein
MFNGGPATFADIEANATFERTPFAQTCDQLINQFTPVVAVIGAAGVGKTTFGRQILKAMGDREFLAFEHRIDFPFQSQHWIAIEKDLRAKGQRGFLMLDECTRYLRQASSVVDHLASIDKPALQVVLTANAAQWAPRVKAASIFSKGRLIELSRLDDSEIHSLINLVQFNSPIASLVDNSFKTQNRGKQFSRLREKCSADMFVCLKNIFANESLDNILLGEYHDLPEPLQELYRYAAALESVGTRVHRQLLMRMTNLPADQVAAALAGLSGIIDEFDIKPKEGISRGLLATS